MQYTLYKDKELSLLFDKSIGKWYARNNSTGLIQDISGNNNLSIMLRLFHLDPFTFIAELKKQSKSNNLDESIVDLLPLRDTIYFCIKNHMFYWLDLAIEWLLIIKIDATLADILKQTAFDKNVPQNLRHKLVKFIEPES